jgi:hypothetical protein
VLRIPAVIAVLGLSALTLAACASGPSAASCERADSDASALALVQTSGDLGQPSVKVAAPLVVDTTVFTDETVGDGTRVTTQQQDVDVAATLVNGSTGTVVAQGVVPAQSVARWGQSWPALATMMTCATEGSRIVGAFPAKDLSSDQAQGFGLSEDDTVVATIDLTKVYLPAADGTPQYDDRRGMPSVVLAPNGRPGIIIPDADAPTDLTVETLKKGSGHAITADDTARVQYTSVDWNTRKVVDSTWEDGASKGVTTADALPFAPELLGATVGSQLLVVVPPTADGGAATVYVVDILGIDAPTTATQ